MIRSSIGISNQPVEGETDPGFGVDTEQRRVEFATKLEEEAYSIALDDAEEVARKNLVRALRLWARDDLIQYVEKLSLREIMFIWLLFEVSFLSEFWALIDNETSKELILVGKDNFKEFISEIFQSVFTEIKLVEGIDNSYLKKIRDQYGGDLLFSLKNSNETEIFRIYRFTYKKLPKSLRDQLKEIIIGVKLDVDMIVENLKKSKDVKKDLTKLILFSLEQSDKEKIKIKSWQNVVKFIEIYDKQLSVDFLKTIEQIDNSKQSEVDQKVKKYYGIK